MPKICHLSTLYNPSVVPWRELVRTKDVCLEGIIPGRLHSFPTFMGSSPGQLIFPFFLTRTQASW